MNRKLNCIIVDDEPNAHFVLEHYFKQTDKISLLNSFFNGVEAIEFISNNQVDLIFLDINMPGITGFEMLQSLSYSPLVIFITAYSQYALDGYKYNVVDYLLKPIELESFLAAIDKAVKRMSLVTIAGEPISAVESQSDNFITIKTDRELIKVRFEAIVYVQSYGNYVKIVSHDRNYVTSVTTFEIERKLPKDKFLRIHKSYIVSLEHVSRLDSNVIFIKSLKLPIGNTYKREVLGKLEILLKSRE